MSRPKIAWTNTAERYGKLAMLLHWTIAMLFLALYVSVYYRHWFTEEGTPANIQAIQLHFSFGMSVAALILFRIVYRIRGHWPDEVPAPAYQHLLARLVHIALYAIMVIMPVTGYLGTKADTEFFNLFTITKFADTALYSAIVTEWLGMSFEEFEAPLDWVHHTLGKAVVWIVILAHAAAAIYHHAAIKDNVLRRMLPTQ